MKVKVGVSRRHVHLTKEDYNKIFDEEITVKEYLKQPGQFAANQTVTLKHGDKIIESVRVVGPTRSYTQVELSRTDAYTLKINPPIRKSGDLTNAEEITIIGPNGSITKNACIIPERHIHISKQAREEYNLLKDEYSIKIDGEKSGILGNVKFSEQDTAVFELHIDSDDANAFNIKQNDELEIII